MYSLIIGPLLFRIDPEGWQSYIRSFLVNWGTRCMVGEINLLILLVAILWNILLIFVVRTFNEKNYDKFKGYIYVGSSDVLVYNRNAGTDRNSQ